MDVFAPEICKHWLAGRVEEDPARKVETDEERAALEALAERVSAARLVM